jgi:hypothetical protein
LYSANVVFGIGLSRRRSGITAGVLGQTPELTSSGLWKPAHFPSSFEYGGKQSAQLLGTWHFTHIIGRNKKPPPDGGSPARRIDTPYAQSANIAKKV